MNKIKTMQKVVTFLGLCKISIDNLIIASYDVYIKGI